MRKSWHLVRSTPKVLGFIGGTSDKPGSYFTAKEAETILQRMQDSSEKPKPESAV